MFGGGAQARVGKEAREGEKGESARGKKSDGLARLFIFSILQQQKLYVWILWLMGMGLREGRKRKE